MIEDDSYKHKGLRRALIEELLVKGIRQKEVLAAIEAVPRHYFMDSAFLTHAYEDKAFPIGEGQTISQPYTVAFQTELLQVKPGEKILEIGTGSGYQACILSAMGAKVYTIEVNKNLFKKTQHLIKYLGFSNIRMTQGDGSEGLPAFAPFDAILVTAGAPYLSDKLIDQIAIGGRLVIPIGDLAKQEMVRITKLSDTHVRKETFGSFKFVPLVGKNAWQKKH